MSPVNIAGYVSRRRVDAGEAKAVSSDVGEGEAREIKVTRRRRSSQDSLSSLRRVDRPPELRRSIGDWKVVCKANCGLLSGPGTHTPLRLRERFGPDLTGLSKLLHTK